MLPMLLLLPSRHHYGDSDVRCRAGAATCVFCVTKWTWLLVSRTGQIQVLDLLLCFSGARRGCTVLAVVAGERYDACSLVNTGHSGLRSLLQPGKRKVILNGSSWILIERPTM